MAARKAPRVPSNGQARGRRSDSTRPTTSTGDNYDGDRALGSTDDERAADAPLDRQVVRAVLAAAGLLAPPPEFDDLPTDAADVEASEREDESWLLATFTQPLGLSAAVIEDRG